MAVTSTNTASAASTTSSSTAAKDRNMLAKNFDQFLTLLTTQLKNQNPLDPLDTNEFTQQLVQFASVEQQIKSNDTLNALLSATRSSTATSVVNFVGMTVTAEGATTQLKGGKATWSLTAPRAAQASITVKNAAGEVVYTGTSSLAAGTQEFGWNGRSSAGTALPDGAYTIGVTATDSSGKGVTVTSEVTGVVDMVDVSSETPVLTIGAISVPVDKVKTMRRTAS